MVEEITALALAVLLAASWWASRHLLPHRHRREWTAHLIERREDGDVMCLHVLCRCGAARPEAGGEWSPLPPLH